MNKEIIRKELLNIRKNITEKADKSIIITNKIIDLDIYKDSQVIAIYNSLPDEVDTKYLMDNMLSKKILLPKIVNDNIEFIMVNKNTKYIKNNYGILEPIGNLYLGNIDLIIVPGVAFDKNHNRLGFGKGYYDKYLSNKTIYKIGICYDKQIVHLLPSNDLDIKMDMVITENRVY